VSVIPCNEEQMWELVTTICKNTAQNKSSMLRDIEEGRKTEIDAILGYVLAEAKKIEREVAITQFLYDSIKGMERRGG
jgi:2-dehydropantoate 2-reductase